MEPLSEQEDAFGRLLLDHMAGEAGHMMLELDDGLLVRVCLRLESEAMMRVSPRLLEVAPSGRGQASPPAHGVLRATPDFAA